MKCSCKLSCSFTNFQYSWTIFISNLWPKINMAWNMNSRKWSQMMTNSSLESIQTLVLCVPDIFFKLNFFLKTANNTVAAWKLYNIYCFAVRHNYRGQSCLHSTTDTNYQNNAIETTEHTKFQEWVINTVWIINTDIRDMEHNKKMSNHNRMKSTDINHFSYTIFTKKERWNIFHFKFNKL